MTTPYWPYYCEENVWHMCGREADGDAASFAVIVSNAQRAVAVWHQRAAPPGQPFVVWDYHVVLLAHGGGGWRVEDPDSTLEMPTAAERYLESTFPEVAALDRFRPRFRVVPAVEYRARLCTDRSHMRAPDGTWHAPPPPWSPIGEGSNLMELVDLDRAALGRVLDLAGLWELIARAP